MKVVSQSKKQMIDLPNVNVHSGGVRQILAPVVSAVTEDPWIIMPIEGMEGEKVIRIVLQDLL